MKADWFWTLLSVTNKNFDPSAWNKSQKDESQRKAEEPTGSEWLDLKQRNRKKWTDVPFTDALEKHLRAFSPAKKFWPFQLHFPEASALRRWIPLCGASVPSAGNVRNCRVCFFWFRLFLISYPVRHRPAENTFNVLKFYWNSSQFEMVFHVFICLFLRVQTVASVRPRPRITFHM